MSVERVSLLMFSSVLLSAANQSWEVQALPAQPDKGRDSLCSSTVDSSIRFAGRVLLEPFSCPGRDYPEAAEPQPKQLRQDEQDGQDGEQENQEGLSTGNLRLLRRKN